MSFKAVHLGSIMLWGTGKRHRINGNITRRIFLVSRGCKDLRLGFTANFLRLVIVPWHTSTWKGLSEYSSSSRRLCGGVGTIDIIVGKIFATICWGPATIIISFFVLMVSLVEVFTPRVSKLFTRDSSSRAPH